MWLLNSPWYRDVVIWCPEPEWEGRAGPGQPDAGSSDSLYSQRVATLCCCYTHTKYNHTEIIKYERRTVDYIIIFYVYLLPCSLWLILCLQRIKYICWLLYKMTIDIVSVVARNACEILFERQLFNVRCSIIQNLYLIFTTMEFVAWPPVPALCQTFYLILHNYLTIQSKIYIEIFFLFRPFPCWRRHPHVWRLQERL